jgi:hypothetical protein
MQSVVDGISLPNKYVVESTMTHYPYLGVWHYAIRRPATIIKAVQRRDKLSNLVEYPGCYVGVAREPEDFHIMIGWAWVGKVYSASKFVDHTAFNVYDPNMRDKARSRIREWIGCTLTH